MKKIGLIGGLSYASSVESYRQMAVESNRLLSNHATAEIFIISLNPSDIFSAMHDENWKKVSEILINAALKLEKLGAECIMTPCNTAHKVSKEIEENISVPFISIVDCVGKFSMQNKYTKLGLLGTRFTMEDGFYQDYLYKNFNIKIILPEFKFRKMIHKIIFNELCKSDFNSNAKNLLKKVCQQLYEEMECEAIILGCTELPLLLKQDETMVPLIDTLRVQANYTVKFAMGIQ